MAPRRFLNGISSVSTDNPIGSLPYLDPTTWSVWFEDFHNFPADWNDASVKGWTHTNTNGTVSFAGTTGDAILTLAGADNDLSQFYVTNATFTLTSGKKCIFEAKAKVDKGAGGTIGQEEIFVGLSSVQTGANFTAADGSAMTADDCVGFWSIATTAALNAIVRDTDVESISNVLTYVDATSYVLSWVWDGVSTINFYVNDSAVATITDYPADTVLTPMLFVKAGAAHAKVLTTDYILVARER